MEKEFIPYEQALSLKELGFDEECLTQSKHKKLCSNKEQPGGCQLHNLHCAYPDCTIDKTVESIPLPLYQQAFRWFRKKYQIVFCYEPCLKKDLTYIFFIYVEVTGEKVFVVESKYNEEAELTCLQKMIEIVKTK